MKELDVLFEAFFATQAVSIAAGHWRQLEDMLAQDDPVLIDWISGRNLPADPDMLNLIAALTHAT